MPIQIQFRRGTYAQWSSSNPVLADGEFALQTDAGGGQAAGQFKIGDGSTAWSSLAYGGLVGPQGPTTANIDGGLSNSTYTAIDLDGGNSGPQ